MTGLDDSSNALFTDLYELTMARAYQEGAMDQIAVFELLLRRLPRERGFALIAGLDQVLGYLESLRFTPSDLAYLAGLGLFPDGFLRQLESFRFTGDVLAMPEGTAAFPGEPILRITAPMREAQLVETFVINQMHYQSLVATKAARVKLSAKGKSVVEFGARRAHGTDAALKAARCAWLAGFDATSNVQAGKLYGLPVAGTMAHSFVQASPDEEAAFTLFAGLFPDTTLLVDTYDALASVDRIVKLSRERGPAFKAGCIRLDSGDLDHLSRVCREKLDNAGLAHVRIFASGDLDEYAIDGLVSAGAPIDGFGVGTRLVVSKDAPTLELSYKLVEYAGRGRAKLSPGKAMFPGRKRVRRFMEQGRMVRDVICLEGEESYGEELLREVMRGGVRTEHGRDTLETCRKRAADQLAALPEEVRWIHPPASPEDQASYRVEVSDVLRQDLARLRLEHS